MRMLLWSEGMRTTDSFHVIRGTIPLVVVITFKREARITEILDGF